MGKRSSAAANRNKLFILPILKKYVVAPASFLEIGSGTGEHLRYFSESFPEVNFQPSDDFQNHASINSWNEDRRNVSKALTYLAGVNSFPGERFEYIYTANTLHIMSWEECKILLKDLSKHLVKGSKLFIYGPFKYQGEFTSASNKEFDSHLKARDPQSGIKHFEQIKLILEQGGIKLIKDYDMPANNQFLIFEKLS